tara:strand:- start:7556 stop:8047 length:492 start_codon:yes stop_codon:yes gene_type:complete
MNDEINYQNNPLHGVSLKNLLTEIVGHYGFEMLFAYLNINCFKTNPSIESSVKFLKKTDWARLKVETFYLYQFKNLPRASSEQFALPPRERIVPADQTPREPAQLSLEDAKRLREKRAKKSLERDQNAGYRPKSTKSRGARSESRESTGTTSSDTDPWAKWKK